MRKKYLTILLVVVQATMLLFFVQKTVGNASPMISYAAQQEINDDQIANSIKPITIFNSNSQPAITSSRTVTDPQPVINLFHPTFQKNNFGQNSTLHLHNPSEGTAVLVHSFYDSAGANVFVETDSIPTKGSSVIKADQLAGLADGVFSLVISADLPVESVVYDENANNGTFALNCGLSEGHTLQYLGPFYKDALNTAVQIMNLSTTAADVVTTFYHETGSEALVLTDAVEPYATVNHYAPTLPGLPSGFSGWVVVSSSTAVAAQLIQITPFDGSIYQASLWSSASAHFLGRVMKAYDEGGGARTSRIFVSNPSTLPATVVIQYYAQDGTAVYSSNFFVDRNGSHVHDLGQEAIPDSNGIWAAVIFADQAIVVDEIIQFDADSTFAASAYRANDDLSAGLNPVHLPRTVADSANHSVLNLFNPSLTDGSANLVYYDLAGSTVFSQSVPLVGQGWDRINLDTIGELGGSYQGSMIIDSTQVLMAWVDEYQTPPTAPPVIQSVTPQQGANDVPITLDIFGSNLNSVTSASLGNNNQQILLEGLLPIDNTHLRSIVPINSSPGSYTLTLANDGSVASLPHAYEVISPTLNEDLYAHALGFWLAPITIRTGNAITPRMGLRVHRQGGQTPLVAAVEVDFYQGNPSAGGVYLGTGTVAVLEPDGVASTTPVNWSPLPNAGTYMLHAIIDPDDFVAENNELNNIVSQTVTILPPLPDILPPVVGSFEANNGSETSHVRQIPLNTTAHDNPGGSGVANLIYIEYEFIQSVGDWVPVAISDWLPYLSASNNYSWTFQPDPGVHYLQVWAADKAGNISSAPQSQFVNYLPPSIHLAQSQIHIYRYPLDEGQTISITLTATNLDDADLYLWRPDNLLANVREFGDPNREIAYTVQTGEAGIFQIEVEGLASTDYQLAISLDGTPLSLNNRPLRIAARSTPFVLPADDPSEEDVGLPSAPEEYEHVYLPAIIKK